jgi:hypothetical protein
MWACVSRRWNERWNDEDLILAFSIEFQQVIPGSVSSNESTPAPSDYLSYADACAYVSIRQHTSAYGYPSSSCLSSYSSYYYLLLRGAARSVGSLSSRRHRAESIRQHPPASVSVRQCSFVRLSETKLWKALSKSMRMAAGRFRRPGGGGRRHLRRVRAVGVGCCMRMTFFERWGR